MAFVIEHHHCRYYSNIHPDMGILCLMLSN
jgi:hypothetical protein